MTEDAVPVPLANEADEFLRFFYGLTGEQQRILRAAAEGVILLVLPAASILPEPVAPLFVAD